MIVIGLTGPSGAGKTFASQIFKNNGFEVINCDQIARETISSDKQVILALSDHFGTDIIGEDGTINRIRLGERAFKDKKSVDILNAVTHPAIIRGIQLLIEAMREKGAKKILLDAPTLYESHADALCQKVLAVTADKALCAKRIIERDNLSLSQAMERINAQPGNVFYSERADAVIFNTGDTEKFKEDVLRFIKAVE